MTTSGSQLEVRGALVTGATSGLGRAVAVSLATCGMNVAVLGRSEQDLADLERELASLGVRVVTLAVDLADAAAL